MNVTSQPNQLPLFGFRQGVSTFHLLPNLVFECFETKQNYVLNDNVSVIVIF